MAEGTLVRIESDLDIVSARMQGRAIAVQLGFGATAATLIATAISELARNVLLYAGRGEIVLTSVEHGTRRGLAVLAQDRGPGIPDIPRAMQDGYSTSGRLGLGLPGVRRLMDDFEIESSAGAGVRIVAKKWMPYPMT
ncbi:MAG: anti-sigma regulatory factor [Candidatus Eisenbacteria bacterium]|nr:anti-sigma regulatory factor [Candidatus Eisenbacteria bacterium]